jgi:hypothetical protein
MQGSRWLNAAAGPDAPASAIQGGAVVPDLQDSVAAFWQTSATQLRVAAFDAGGPSRVAAKIPAKARAKHSVLMSITFADLWSQISGRTVWNFGDHKPATGTGVRHAYRTAGRYTIGVSARDRLGNPRTPTYRILIARSCIPAAGLRPARVASVWRPRAVYDLRPGGGGAAEARCKVCFRHGRSQRRVRQRRRARHARQ